MTLRSSFIRWSLAALPAVAVAYLASAQTPRTPLPVVPASGPVAGLQLVTNTVAKTVAPGTSGIRGYATCPAGKKPLGGGYELLYNGGGIPALVPLSSGPVVNGGTAEPTTNNGWNVSFAVTGGQSGGVTLYIYAICANA
ncbi:MAG: hypothetical protein ACHQU1_05950 [Gemmatimonadales bacterium]